MNVNAMLSPSAETFTKQDLIGIYEEYSPGIYRYAIRLLGDKAVAEDCVSETFSRLLHAVRRGGGPTENARAYLYRVAHNWIMDYYRRQTPIHQSIDTSEPIDPGSNPSKVLSEVIERERVRAALVSLPPEQQQVIQLRFLEDWSHDEVADLLGKTIDATRSLQYRAMVSLRRILIEDEEED